MPPALWILLFCVMASGASDALPVHGIYGARTTALDKAYFSPKSIGVRSPDGRSTAVARGDQDKDTFKIRIAGALGAGEYPVASG